MSNAYGYAHQKQRAWLMRQDGRYVYGTGCPMCGQPLLRGQALDLDHTVPLALGGRTGDRMVHASCNRSAGAALGNRLRGGHGSRDW